LLLRFLCLDDLPSLKAAAIEEICKPPFVLQELSMGFENPLPVQLMLD